MACFCEMNVIRDQDGDWLLENEFDISGCIMEDKRVRLSAGVDVKGFYLIAQDIDGAAEWHPPFCPFCGRKLRK